MTILTHHRYLIKIGLIIAAALAIGLAILYPTITNIMATSEQIRAEQVNLEYKVRAGLNIKQVNQDLEEAKVVMVKAEEIFIPKGEELAFIKTLEDMAARHQIAINIVPEFKQPIEGEKLYPLPVQISIAGTWPQIIKMINEIERLPYYYLPSTINISNRGVGTHPYSAVINGSVYISSH